jgi:hypothetical protein
MKKVVSILLTLVLFVSSTSCSDDDKDSLQPEIVGTGNLVTPSNNAAIAIDAQSGPAISFSWSPAQSKDGGLVQYKVLFDKVGGDFSDPIYEAVSNATGTAASLTLTQAYLNVIAESAGIAPLDTGSVIWTVQASSSYLTKRFADSFTMSLTRPEGLATFPEFMYIYGSATEGTDLSNAVAFKQLTNKMPTDSFDPGMFESITYLKPGEYHIANSNDAATASMFHLNAENEITFGDQPTAFSLEEGVYRVRMDLTHLTITFEKMENVQMVIMANQMYKAQFTYVGNHVFEATNGFFNFLTPGAPEAPSWLGWEEERYRFSYELDGQPAQIGSYHNADMNGSVVNGFTAYNVRPNGDQPESYYNSYFLAPAATQWEGAWKFPDAYNGNSFTVRIVFDPTAENYYHELKLN